MTSAVAQKLRILCVHGYAQSVSQLRGRTGALRRYLKDIVEFDYVQAPFLLENEQNEDNSSESKDNNKYSWWRHVDEEADGTVKYEGVDETFQVLRNKMQTDGPFDGLLGFSQGACVVGILARMLLHHQNNEKLGLRFVILVGGFLPRDRTLRALFDNDEGLSLPSMHVWGETDEIITPQRSQALADTFLNPHIHTHPGAHYFPTHKQMSLEYRSFFDLIK